MQKLTAKLIETVALPSHKQVILRDSELKGFGLRLTPGGMSYIVEARINGKPKRLTVGRADLLSADEARKEATRLLAQMTTGTDPQLERQKLEASQVTLGEVLDHYLTVQRLKANTSNGYRYRIKNSFPDWLAKPLTSITPEMILARHKELPKPNKYGTSGQSCANIAMKQLLTLINFAINNLGVKMDNPVQILNKNRSWYRLNRVHVVIADHQLPAYWKALSKFRYAKVRDFFLLLLLTGLRRGEAQTLRWEHVDFEAKTLTVPAELAKNHHAHVLPLSDVLLALLINRKAACADSAWVFPRKDLTRHIAHQNHSSQVIGQKIGCQFSPHAARRTFVTLASRMGIPHHIVKKLVNHAQVVDIASTYVILGTECLREPMQQITDRFMELMQCHPEEWLDSFQAIKRTFKPPTLAEVMHKYLLAKKLRNSTKLNYEKSIRVDLGDWLLLPVTEITEKMVESRKKELLLRKHGITVHQTFCVLRAMLYFAAENFETANGRPLLGRNPVRNLAWNKEPIHKSIIDDSILPRWYAALDSATWQTARDHLLFCLLTGLRMREAMTLQWSDVDLDASTIQIKAEVAQNGHALCLPLSRFLVQFLQQRKQLSAESAFVFPGRAGKNAGLRSCQRIVDQVSKQIGHSFTMNDVRRTFINAAVQAGVSQHLIRRLVNMVGARDSTDSFAVADLDQLRQAMERVSTKLLSLMNCSIDSELTG